MEIMAMIQAFVRATGRLSVASTIFVTCAACSLAQATVQIQNMRHDMNDSGFA